MNETFMGEEKGRGEKRGEGRGERGEEREERGRRGEEKGRTEISGWRRM